MTKKFRDLVAETLSPEGLARSDALTAKLHRIKRVRNMAECTDADIAALTDGELAKLISDTRRTLRLMGTSIDMPVDLTRRYLDRLAQEAMRRPPL